MLSYCLLLASLIFYAWGGVSYTVIILASILLNYGTGILISRSRNLSRKKWLNERGISYYLIIAPNKQSIYPEFLPDYFHRGNITTQLDQLTELFAQDTSFHFLDLSDTYNPFIYFRF